MKKVLVLDIDGTLTNSQKVITGNTKTAIIEAMKRGHKVMLASGRPTPGMKRYAEELELSNFYQKIANPKIIESIINGDLQDYAEIIGDLNENQKETIASVVVDKIYKGEFSDLNKVDQLARILGTNLMGKVEEMKSMEEILKKN
jgi:hydroxymethylpyrimidine pyrophosphatase-like HAD family hydrolase